jgi:hypothetical protein
MMLRLLELEVIKWLSIEPIFSLIRRPSKSRLSGGMNVAKSHVASKYINRRAKAKIFNDRTRLRGHANYPGRVPPLAPLSMGKPQGPLMIPSASSTYLKTVFLLFSLFASSRESASSALMRVELHWRPFWAATLLTGDRWLHSIKQVERFRLALLLD